MRLSRVSNVPDIEDARDADTREPMALPGELPDALWSLADGFFGHRLDRAERYASLLATDGVVRGLIGPRETVRIWDRHILNCVAMASLVPERSYVIDVGSGAGLPGIVLAIARPDIDVVLIEPLARRTAFLAEVVDILELDDQILVLRGRAEEAIDGGPLMFHVKPADVVTARAVAPLDRLAGWCLPLVAIGGRLLAMKGSSAREEIDEHADVIARLGGSRSVIHECGTGVLETPTTVVEIVRERSAEIGSVSVSRDGERPRRRPRRG